MGTILLLVGDMMFETAQKVWNLTIRREPFSSHVPGH